MNHENRQSGSSQLAEIPHGNFTRTALLKVMAQAALEALPAAALLAGLIAGVFFIFR
jgi:hypothetical protein